MAVGLIVRRFSNLFLFVMTLLSLGKGLLFNDDAQVLPNDPFFFVGETMSLTCDFTSDSWTNNSVLYFVKDKGGDHTPGCPVDEFAKEITKRSEGKFIQLVRPNVTFDDDGKYYCIKCDNKSNSYVVAWQVLKVDTVPKMIENFSCYYLNREMLVCNWSLGVSYKYNELLNVSLSFKYNTNWSTHDVPEKTSWFSKGFSDRPVQIKVEVKHRNKTAVFKREIDPSDLVKPTPVTNLKARPVNSTCTELSWNHPSGMPMNFTYMYEHKTQWQTGFSIKNYTGINAKESRYSTILCNLKPFSKYTVNLTVHPLNKKGFPSDLTSNTFTTTEDVPSSAPKICIGCYYESKCSWERLEDCYTLVWKELEEELKNGNVNYSISERNLSINKTTTNNWVEFSKSQLPANQSLQFCLQAYTQKGFSKNCSDLIIPSNILMPNNSVKFVVERKNEFTYYLHWTDDKLTSGNDFQSTSYTIIWCSNNCQLVEWQILSSNESSLEITVNSRFGRDVKIGISQSVVRNGNVVSRGISWARCIYEYYQGPKQPYWIFSEQKLIRRNTEECTAGYIKGFHIEFCPSTKGSTCSGQKKSVNVSNTVLEYSCRLLASDRIFVNVTAFTSAGYGESQLANIECQDPLISEEVNMWWIVICICLVIAPLILFACVVRVCYIRKKKVMKRFNTTSLSPEDDFMKSFKIKSSSASSNEGESSMKPLLKSLDNTRSSDDCSLDHSVASKGSSSADNTVLIGSNVHAGLENNESGISSQNAPSEIVVNSQENSNVTSNDNKRNIEVNSSREGMKNSSSGDMSRGNDDLQNRSGNNSHDSAATSASSCDSYCKMLK
ncbi:interleukin-31 receptor subunit alpha-like isoform X2 [Physella acuta]|uniref:interleukin-31 receptor subunit alpha-like isoform X2 n=1 Tax=Physella acuta TaxID=109671 RepID=UPI0027DAFF16|nr:interleukin-31 receptor subunit alpha-like isoform X2 [Physella acuta]